MHKHRIRNGGRPRRRKARLIGQSKPRTSAKTAINSQIAPPSAVACSAKTTVVRLRSTMSDRCMRGAGTSARGGTAVANRADHISCTAQAETPVAFLTKLRGRKPGQTRGEPKQSAASNDPTKPRYVKARERVAAWAWDLGVNDPELSPNHAWRHTFKAVGFRCGIPEKVLDAIVGHAAASVGRGYGEPTLADNRAP